MKKRIVATLLTLMLLASLATGCGKNTAKAVKLDPNNPVSLKIWHYYNGDQYIKSAAEVFEESVPENTLISRPGGDEFYILFYGYSSRSEI